MARGTRARGYRLTPFEQRMILLMLIALGKSYRESALILGVHVQTVKNRASEIFRLIGVRSKAEAAAVVWRGVIGEQREQRSTGTRR